MDPVAAPWLWNCTGHVMSDGPLWCEGEPSGDSGTHAQDAIHIREIDATPCVNDEATSKYFPFVCEAEIIPLGHSPK